jgi:hypothetical protein
VIKRSSVVALSLLLLVVIVLVCCVTRKRKVNVSFGELTTKQQYALSGPPCHTLVTGHSQMRVVTCGSDTYDEPVLQ